MKHRNSNLLIQVHGIDGSIQSLLQTEPGLIAHTLASLDPLQIFIQDRITLAADQSPIHFIPPLVTRIDLVTDLLSVWDFPFVLGAPRELTEAEFREQLRDLEPQPGSHASDGSPMFFDLQMVSGLQCHLRMEVVIGSKEERLSRIFSILKRRSLLFGLRGRGIGVLNLSNLVRFTVHPDPDETSVNGSGRQPSASRNHNERTNPSHPKRRKTAYEHVQ